MARFCAAAAGNHRWHRAQPALLPPGHAPPRPGGVTLLTGVTKLYACHSGLTSLAGLERLASIRWLYLDRNALSAQELLRLPGACRRRWRCHAVLCVAVLGAVRPGCGMRAGLHSRLTLACRLHCTVHRHLLPLPLPPPPTHRTTPTPTPTPRAPCTCCPPILQKCCPRGCAWRPWTCRATQGAPQRLRRRCSRAACSVTPNTSTAHGCGACEPHAVQRRVPLGCACVHGARPRGGGSAGVAAAAAPPSPAHLPPPALPCKARISRPSKRIMLMTPPRTVV